MKVTNYNDLPILLAGEKYNDALGSTNKKLFLDDGLPVYINRGFPAGQFSLVIHRYFLSVSLF